MGRTFVMGDCHGAHKAMLQCFERAGFTDEDTLIQLGDVVDGWSQSYECVEELLKIKNLVTIRGNHDQWFNEFCLTRKHGSQWTQGAKATAQSYLRNLGWSENIVGALDPNYIPLKHREFFRDQVNYHVIEKDDEKTLFVHGGYNRHYPIEQTLDYLLYWDRDLWSSALSWEAMGEEDKLNYKFKTKDNFAEIYIGHTTTNFWKKDVPMKAAMIWNLDTGAGWSGKLSMMDIDSKELFQSDNVLELYPNEAGRRGSK